MALGFKRGEAKILLNNAGLATTATKPTAPVAKAATTAKPTAPVAKATKEQEKFADLLNSGDSAAVAEFLKTQKAGFVQAFLEVFENYKPGCQTPESKILQSLQDKAAAAAKNAAVDAAEKAAADAAAKKAAADAAVDAAAKKAAADAAA
jgi:hypothetical protein